MPDDLMTIETTENSSPDAGGNQAEDGESLREQGGGEPTPKGNQDEGAGEGPGNGEGEGEAAKDGAEKPEKQTPEGIRRRFSELTGAKREAQAGEAVARAEAERLKAERDALMAALTGKAQAPGQGKADTDPEPKSEDYPGSYEEYERARQDWMERKMAERVAGRVREESAKQAQAQAQEQAQQERVEHAAKAFEAGVTKYGTDFEKVFLPREQGGPALTGVMAESILGTDTAHDVLMYLVQKPEEAERIARLTPVQQVKAVARLEAQLETAAKTAKRTNTSPPPNPVGGRSSGPIQKDEASMSDEEWYTSQLKKKATQAKR